ncbi:MAG: putative metal-binding motif-containing protein [Chitinophagaceae bacterium]|nr:putative metal-binding motif-containing protein [Chitinophagaceae bacterium]
MDDDGFGDLLDAGNSLCNNPGTGFSTNNTDCNDANSLINPSVVESCNTIDDNCNGTADDGLTFISYYADVDDDGFGDLLDAGNSLCNNPGTGFSTNNTDCNDTNSLINPSVVESCNTIDDNCNGTADDGLTFISYYADVDDDGFGNLLDAGNSLCNNPGTGFSTNNTDCNDANPLINPSALESCNTIDDNCNGTADDGLTFISYYADVDDDGFGDLLDTGNSLCNNPGTGFSTNNTDCNDGNPLINPAANESCNNIDDNCNGTADDGIVFITYFADLDHDGFGDLLDGGISLCNNPGTDYSTNNTDCNDGNPLISPIALEICNIIDDNCNGTADDGLLFIIYYVDLDNDGYGNLLDPGNTLCTNPGTGYSTINTDCNDANTFVHPFVLENCNGIDDDCNGTVDDAVGNITYYQDTDNDGFGNPDIQIDSCAQPSGFVISNTDCNDTLSAIFPGAAEICNGTDDNCNGSSDEGLFVAYYIDADQDGFGSSLDAGNSLCTNPGIGFSTNNTDCNDGNAAINPSAIENCNSIDDNCNGATDDGLIFTHYYADLDNDGFGDAFDPGISLCNNPGIGYSTSNTDCNDANSMISPAAVESCNGIDDNCNGTTDDGLVFVTYYPDQDQDGYGNLFQPGITLCNNPGIGYADNNADCYDVDAAINPGITEQCNGIDDNCNGNTDEGLVFAIYYTDADNDGFGNLLDAGNSLCNNPGTGFSLNNADCNDGSSLINPFGIEVCNSIDDNCNGTADEGLTFITYYADADHDGFGSLLDAGNSLCNNPGIGFAINNSDCNDGNAAINPSAIETCNSIDDNCNGTADDGLNFITYYADADNDGFGSLLDAGNSLCNNPGIGFAINNSDCNDGNAAINPSAIEICNSIDDNCNGTADDGLTFITYYADTDNDGFGNLLDAGNSLCVNPGTGFTTTNTDCNDVNAAINPSAIEICNSIDDNCNGTTDDGLSFITYYTDADNDEFGNLLDAGNSLCNNPGTGFSTTNTDCNDANPLINPAAIESCNTIDDNCNGSVDDGIIFITYFADLDHDEFGDLSDTGNSLCNNPGIGFSINNTDCNDGNPLINPIAIESCNGIDDNCNGSTDDGVTFVTYYPDMDMDGYGNLFQPGINLCNNPGTGYATNNTDCYDIDAGINPGITESCNGIDDNCNGNTDEGLAFTTYYADLDHDNFGDLMAVGNSLCNNPGTGFSTNHTDCNDGNPLINPAAIENCNTIDDNCNGTADDGLTFNTYYADADNDGFGDLLDAGNSLCNNPGTGFSTNNTDCNDANPLINPSAIEICNSLDDNCNGTTDDGIIFITYFADLDHDGFGDLLDSGNSLCNNPGTDYVTNNTDCNDGNPLINPAANESCNSIDDNCNGTADDGLLFTDYFIDLDHDGYGELLTAGNSLCNNPGIGFSTNNTDCNDGNPAINPGAVESCNGIDDNCNGPADDGVILTTYYADGDNDGFGNPDIQIDSCAQPSGFVISNTDCDDNLSAVFPGAAEVCNGTDDNCNGAADEGLFISYYIDADNDGFGNSGSTENSLCNDPGTGYSTNNTDCNDGNAAVNPSAFETCNNIDDNCDGTDDDGLIFITYYADADNDGFGSLLDAGNSLCTNPGIGFSTNNTDCNDGNAAINPSAIENCNSIDDNCNGATDDGLIFTHYYADLDNDGFGDAFDPGISLCNNPGIGFATSNTDCNDANSMISPAAVESCNGIDDNCNGTTDDGLVFVTYYPDQDQDGYGNLFQPGITLCNNPGIGYADNNADCYDVDAAINPGITEQCNGIDDNCNGNTDEGLVFAIYYTDADNDGFGNLLDAGNSLCNNPGTGFSLNNADCNDGSSLINPFGIEVCNSIDDNCNGTADEGLTFITYYADADHDGFGNLLDVGNSLCNNPGIEFAINNSDCNDGNAAINPSAIEICNTIDDNCNGTADDGLTFITYYADADNDGFGSLLDAGNSLCNNPGAGFSLNNTDCNDGNGIINPSAIEICNSIDDNCNGTADDGLTFITYYADTDNDGFGNLLDAGNSLCVNPGTGFTTTNTDCNDVNAAINPSAIESCNSIDDNCNGTADDGLIFTNYYPDLDNDNFGDAGDPGIALCNNPGIGYSTSNTDCNDANSLISPSAIESCNSIDDNCNGTTDDGLIFTNYYPDLDNDSYGDVTNPGISLCNNPGIGFSVSNSDCNDSNSLINPNAIESCNGIDDNCNGSTDDGLNFVTYYIDQDQDGYGNLFLAGNDLCNNPGTGYATNNEDCYDVDAEINPGITESCNGIDDNCNGNADEGLIFITYYTDADNDGFGNLLDAGNSLCNNPGTGYTTTNTDCNDGNAAINPSAAESCNNIDDNCNGTADDGLTFITYYADADNDGFGNLLGAGNSLCINPGTGFSTNNTDCNDGNSLINPSAIEICNGIDDNCNIAIDDGLTFITYYADFDNDGYGDLFGTGNSLCSTPGPGFSINNSDCNDQNPFINPTIAETCNGFDDNCNGSADDGLTFITYYTDLDMDGFGDLFDTGNSLCSNPGIGFSSNNTDCNDGNALINPLAIESCNNIDDNCNGTADDGLTFITYYADADNDGFGDLTDVGNSLCENPGFGFSSNNSDCNDGNALINPLAIESCNNVDDNCNGTADDGLTFITYYADADNDGFGSLLDAGNSLCNNPGIGFAINNSDCNDGNAAINPLAIEICNSIDDNCNGTADDGLTFITYYADADNDGFGDLTDVGNSLCENPGFGFSSNNTDCNDGNAAINPLAIETCNNIDDNCNGTSDDGLTFITYYADADNDGFGSLLDAGNSLCNNPGIGFAINNSDCNDGNAAINPSAIEICNNIDDNCNGTADDGLTFITYYTDADNDGFGSLLDAGNSLCNNPGIGFAINNTDCNDGNAAINPSAIESCNNIDDNCNGTADDGLTFITYYADADNDGFGSLLDAGNSLCNNPGIGFAINNTDCNDGNAAINPSAIETCNSIDDNCNGTSDDGLTFITYYTDADNDGFGSLLDAGNSLCNNPGIGFAINNTDCNDGNAAINPSAIESCNNIDDNCNGTADDGLTFITYYADADNDGFGSLLDAGNSLCNNPGIGFAINNSDCNDGNAAINPSAIEICNNIDDNCNGTADDGLTFITYYADADNDGFGSLLDAGNSLCNNPGIGFAINNSDCNDGNAAINPSAIESCNNIDDNCNGTADDGLTFVTYYADADNDGFGSLLDPGNSLCNNPGTGFSTNNTDCNDGNAAINPLAIETCNTIDDNCNGTADDGLTFITYYADADNDGFGSLLDAGNSLCNNPGIGFAINNTDCNDGNAAINPLAIEICNSIDDDCNGTADDGLTFITYYADADNDGFGSLLDAGNSLCNNPGIGFAINNTDCNDGNAAINPSAIENCNSIDDNCNGTADDGLTFITYYADADNDGFGSLLDAGNSFCKNPGIGFAS